MDSQEYKAFLSLIEHLENIKKQASESQMVLDKDYADEGFGILEDATHEDILPD